MKGWVGWILLGLSLVIAYQGYNNSRADPRTEEMARAMVCAEGSNCARKDERATEVRTDIIQRRYGFGTSEGPKHVLCRRTWIFFGNWECQVRSGSIPGSM
jgi:hypothetical protein